MTDHANFYMYNHSDLDDSSTSDQDNSTQTMPASELDGSADTMNLGAQAAATLNQTQSSIIRMLPQEVVSEIFTLCILPFNPYSRKTYDRFAPITLGSICSCWRNIAWTTPQLWASPTFRLVRRDKVMKDLSFIKEWIQRSGSLPLSIRWHLTGLEDEWESSIRDTVMQVIFHGCSRWKDVDLRFSTYCCRYLPTTANAFPLLQSLMMKQPCGDPKAPFVNFSESTPVLTEMSITRFYLRSIRARWDALTTLEVRQLYIDECLELFRQTPNVVNLIVRRVVAGDDGYEIPKRAIVLPCLRTLDIFMYQDIDMLPFFEKITTPELTHFRFFTCSYLGSWLVEGIISCFKHSDCRMEVAILSVVDEDDVFRLWSLFPSLTVVSLGDKAVMKKKMHPVLNRDILSALNTPESTRLFPVYYLLPALEQLGSLL